MAQEAHAQVIDGVVEDALHNANLTPFDLSAVAVTIGPGLSLCLRVGVRKARILAGKHNLPMVGIHHMEAHALVARLTEKELQFPFLALLISGVMVAWTGIEHFRLGRWEPPPAVEEPEDGWLDLRPRWQLGEIFAEGRSSSPSLRRARIHPSLTSSIQMSLQNNS